MSHFLLEFNDVVSHLFLVSFGYLGYCLVQEELRHWYPAVTVKAIIADSFPGIPWSLAAFIDHYIIPSAISLLIQEDLQLTWDEATSSLYESSPYGLSRYSAESRDPVTGQGLTELEADSTSGRSQRMRVVSTGRKLDWQRGKPEIGQSSQSSTLPDSSPYPSPQRSIIDHTHKRKRSISNSPDKKRTVTPQFIKTTWSFHSTAEISMPLMPPIEEWGR